jgi:hypothetical protein
VLPLVIALLTLVAGDPAPPAPDIAPPPGWVSRSVPSDDPRQDDWTCANWSPAHWSVSAAGGRLTIAPDDGERRRPSLPFKPVLEPKEAARNFQHPSVVRPVADGFLVGFDHGEFGGGLTWFNRAGTKHVRISPPAAKERDWFPENVVGIFEHQRAFYVFQGLAHLAARRGRVLKVERDPQKGWGAVVLVADLETAPEAILEESPGRWLVAAANGIVRVTAAGAVERIWQHKMLGTVIPRSIARTPDGIVYVGMRAWVLRVAGLERGPARVDVLAPVACARFGPKPSPREWSVEGCGCVASGDGGARD